MKRHLKLSNVGPNEPLRLEVAAALAYPDGSMTVSGLRREAKKGRLVIERTAGRDYTTLAAVKRMRELCLVAPSVLDFTPNRRDVIPARAPFLSDPSGSSETALLSAAQASALRTINDLLSKPSKNSPPTSLRNTRRAKAAGV